MVQKTAVLSNPTGTKLIALIKNFDCAITLTCGDKSANPKSILNILAMGLKQGAEVVVKADGENEQQAVDEVSEYLETFRDSGEQ